MSSVALLLVIGRIRNVAGFFCLALMFFCLVPGQVFAGQDTQKGGARAADKVQKEDFSHTVVAMLTTDDRGERLKMPSGLFFDPRADELYLLSGSDNRFIVYGPDYFPQESLGKGRGIDAPVDGVFTSEGNILIPQGGAPGKKLRLTMINSAFLPVKELSLDGVPDIRDFTPEHIALGKDGVMYLTGLESARVLLLSADGGFLRWITVAIGAGGEYQAQAAGSQSKSVKIRNVAVDSQGNVYLLSEETSKTYVFDPYGSYLFAFGAKGGAEGKLSRPRALALDERKKCIYVVDYMRHTILVYDFSGVFRYEFGGFGWGPGWFNYPVDIVVGRQGQVIVADFFNQRAQVFEVTVPDLPDRDATLWQSKPQDDGAKPETKLDAGGGQGL